MQGVYYSFNYCQFNHVKLKWCATFQMVLCFLETPACYACQRPDHLISNVIIGGGETILFDYVLFQRATQMNLN